MIDEIKSIFALAPEPASIPDESDWMRNRRSQITKSNSDILVEARKIKASRIEEAWRRLQDFFGEADYPIHTFT